MSSSVDRLLSRRASWTGQIIQGFNCPPNAPDYGHYFLVTFSYYNGPNDWRVESRDLGPHRPPNEVIYTFDGSTWDMPAQATTVFPWIATMFCATGAVVCWPLGHAMFGNYETSGLVFIFCLIQPLWAWFYKIEPTRASKVAAAYTAASEVRAAMRTAGDERRRESEADVGKMVAEVNDFVRKNQEEAAARAREQMSGLRAPDEKAK